MSSSLRAYIADDELETLVENAFQTGEHLWIVAGGRRYEIAVTGAENSTPDDEAVERTIQAIRAAAGSWSGRIDAGQFKSYIAEKRREPGRTVVDQ